MKKLQTLSIEQQALVEQHLSVVHWTIHHFIKTNESIFGFEYADLFGEGCLWLCKAALTYNSERGSFAAYAQTVVKNGLLSYTRIMCQKQSRQRLLLDPMLPDDSCSFGELIADKDDFIDATVTAIDVEQFFKAIKARYSGVTLRGIEALELKTKGYTSGEIAVLHGVKANHVEAWISRAVSKLRQDEMALKAFDRAS